MALSASLLLRSLPGLRLPHRHQRSLHRVRRCPEDWATAMNRCRTRAIAFLVAGAIINIGLTIGLAWRATRWHRNETLNCDLEATLSLVGSGWQTQGLTTDGGWEMNWHTGGAPRNDMEEFSIPGFLYRHAITDGQGTITINAGWPMYALKRDWPSEQFGADRSVRGLREPIWPGFAVNTLFYAGVLWVVFAGPLALRRMIRRRRGQCPTCAYPIGQSPVCTECGTPHG